MRWLLAFMLVCGVSVFAEDYLTEGVDHGRTGWMKNEKVFTTANVGSMKLLWKIKVNSTPRQMHNLFSPLTVSGVTTARGARELAIFAGISDELYAVDVATGEMIWEKKFDSIYPSVTAGVGSTLCPGGQTAVPVITTTPTKGKYNLYAVSWDGRLRTLDVATGADVAPPDKFAGPNGKPYALNLFNGVIYTSTAQGCGGNTNAFLSYDLQTKKSSIFAPAGGGMWGRRGVAIDPEGRVFMGTGDAPFAAETNSLGTAVVAVKLDANKELQFVDYFAPSNANWLWRRDLDLNVTPVAFDYRGRKFLVATSKECRLWLLDRDDLGGADNRTTLQTTPLLCNDLYRRSTRKASGARSPPGRMPKAVSGSSCRFTGPSAARSKLPSNTHVRSMAASRHTRSRNVTASGSSFRSGSRATWTWPSMRSSPTASSLRMPAERTHRRSSPTARSTIREVRRSAAPSAMPGFAAFRRRGAQRFTRSTR